MSSIAGADHLVVPVRRYTEIWCNAVLAERLTNSVCEWQNTSFFPSSDQTSKNPLQLTWMHVQRHNPSLVNNQCNRLAMLTLLGSWSAIPIASEVSQHILSGLIPGGVG